MFSLFFSNHYAMKAYGGVNVKSALDGGEISFPFLPLSPWESVVVTID
jgi:hypothetical protein